MKKYRFVVEILAELPEKYEKIARCIPGLMVDMYNHEDPDVTVEILDYKMEEL